MVQNAYYTPPPLVTILQPSNARRYGVRGGGCVIEIHALVSVVRGGASRRNQEPDGQHTLTHVHAMVRISDDNSDLVAHVCRKTGWEYQISTAVNLNKCLKQIKFLHCMCASISVVPSNIRTIRPCKHYNLVNTSTFGWADGQASVVAVTCHGGRWSSSPSLTRCSVIWSPGSVGTWRSRSFLSPLPRLQWLPFSTLP